MEWINLISDTVTKPTPAMLEAMFQAEVGDDVFREDPTVNDLEEKVAQLFGHEAALFCPSGTMTNQIAINVHTGRLDEMICEENSHVYRSEAGGYAFNSQIAVQPIRGEYGKITAEQIQAVIKPPYDWLPKSRLVVLENTANLTGGAYYRISEVDAIRELCTARGLALHLDGARLFNALVETGESARDWGQRMDSISLCLSKGLGAPVGSVLSGNQAFITQARRVRKAIGGGMRQAGYLAAAGIYALDHHVDRLKTDHGHARALAQALAATTWVEDIRPVHTNIIVFDTRAAYPATVVLEALKEQGLLATAFGPHTIRMVTHLDVSSGQLDKAMDTIRNLKLD